MNYDIKNFYSLIFQVRPFFFNLCFHCIFLATKKASEKNVLDRCENSLCTRNRTRLDQTFVRFLFFFPFFFSFSFLTAIHMTSSNNLRRPTITYPFWFGGVVGFIRISLKIHSYNDDYLFTIIYYY